MRAAILVVWAIGLVGALAATVIVLKEVALVVETLTGIEKLASRTLEAAQGIRANVSAISKLSALEAPVAELDSSTLRLVSAARAVEQKLASLDPAGVSRT